MEIIKDLKCPFIINQSRYSIFDRHIETDGLKDFASNNGCGIIAFSPMAQGLLSDKYLHGISEVSRINRDDRFLKSDQLTEDKLNQISALNNIAKSRWQSLAQMALSWVLKDDVITSVLIGSSRPKQIIENIDIVDKCTFTIEAIDKISQCASKYTRYIKEVI